MFFHLRRIGPKATVISDSSRIICFRKNLTIIGRNQSQVDYVICSKNYKQNAIISRRHCRVRRDEGRHTVVDDSRNGVFINDTKINVQSELQEGDTITFGHPTGEKLSAGTRVRQPDSEYQYLMEHCICEEASVSRDRDGQFVIPTNPPPLVPPVSQRENQSVVPPACQQGSQPVVPPSSPHGNQPLVPPSGQQGNQPVVPPSVQQSTAECHEEASLNATSGRKPLESIGNKPFDPSVNNKSDKGIDSVSADFESEGVETNNVTASATVIIQKKVDLEIEQLSGTIEEKASCGEKCSENIALTENSVCNMKLNECSTEHVECDKVVQSPSQLEKETTKKITAIETCDVSDKVHRTDELKKNDCQIPSDAVDTKYGSPSKASSLNTLASESQEETVLPMSEINSICTLNSPDNKLLVLKSTLDAKDEATDGFTEKSSDTINDRSDNGKEAPIFDTGTDISTENASAVNKMVEENDRNTCSDSVDKGNEVLGQIDNFKDVGIDASSAGTDVPVQNIENLASKIDSEIEMTPERSEIESNDILVTDVASGTGAASCKPSNTEISSELSTTIKKSEEPIMFGDVCQKSLDPGTRLNPSAEEQSSMEVSEVPIDEFPIVAELNVSKFDSDIECNGSQENKDKLCASSQMEVEPLPKAVCKENEPSETKIVSGNEAVVPVEEARMTAHEHEVNAEDSDISEICSHNTSEEVSPPKVAVEMDLSEDSAMDTAGDNVRKDYENQNDSHQSMTAPVPTEVANEIPEVASPLHLETADENREVTSPLHLEIADENQKVTSPLHMEIAVENLKVASPLHLENVDENLEIVNKIQNVSSLVHNEIADKNLEMAAPVRTEIADTVPEMAAPVHTEIGDKILPDLASPVHTEIIYNILEVASPLHMEIADKFPEVASPVHTEIVDQIPDMAASVHTEIVDKIPEVTSPVHTENVVKDQDMAAPVHMEINEIVTTLISSLDKDIAQATSGSISTQRDQEMSVSKDTVEFVECSPNIAEFMNKNATTEHLNSGMNVEEIQVIPVSDPHAESVDEGLDTDEEQDQSDRVSVFETVVKLVQDVGDLVDNVTSDSMHLLNLEASEMKIEKLGAHSQDENTTIDGEAKQVFSEVQQSLKNITQESLSEAVTTDPMSETGDIVLDNHDKDTSTNDEDLAATSVESQTKHIKTSSENIAEDVIPHESSPGGVQESASPKLEINYPKDQIFENFDKQIANVVSPEVTFLPDEVARISENHTHDAASIVPDAPLEGEPVLEEAELQDTLETTSGVEIKDKDCPSLDLEDLAAEDQSLVFKEKTSQDASTISDSCPTDSDPVIEIEGTLEAISAVDNDKSLISEGELPVLPEVIQLEVVPDSVQVIVQSTVPEGSGSTSEEVTVTDGGSTTDNQLSTEVEQIDSDEERNELDVEGGDIDISAAVDTSTIMRSASPEYLPDDHELIPDDHEYLPDYEIDDCYNESDNVDNGKQNISTISTSDEQLQLAEDIINDSGNDFNSSNISSNNTRGSLNSPNKRTIDLDHEMTEAEPCNIETHCELDNKSSNVDNRPDLLPSDESSTVVNTSSLFGSVQSLNSESHSNIESPVAELSCNIGPQGIETKSGSQAGDLESPFLGVVSNIEPAKRNMLSVLTGNYSPMNEDTPEISSPELDVHSPHLPDHHSEHSVGSESNHSWIEPPYVPRSDNDSSCDSESDEDCQVITSKVNAHKSDSPSNHEEKALKRERIEDLSPTDNKEGVLNSEGSETKPRRLSVLERIRARNLERTSITPKQEPKQEPEGTPSTSAGLSGSQETPGGLEEASARRSLEADLTLEERARAANYSRRSEEILTKLSKLLRSQPQLNAHGRVQAWQTAVTKLREKILLPQTIIAVVGDTGSGKSSLMNALLDHADILPTSGMRACTAVVVEITNNPASDKYQAAIEFLSEKEWYDELDVLLSELQNQDGTVKSRQPDPKSEAGVAWSKIRAVYGPFQDGVTPDQLKRNRAVTHWLGKVKTIQDTRAKEFRKRIDHYIESTDTGAGGDYWPIVKHVRIRIPNCEVCRSGATLVDLPGIRDSNAARDKIAKDFLKNCTAVWVVASIHRAVDDKTAKDLLGEHFRRQLLMDGQYGSVSFICTKTDGLVPSEIIRGLHLEDEVALLEQELQDLEVQEIDSSTQLETIKQEISEINDRVENLRTDKQELEEDELQLTQITSTNEPTDNEDDVMEELRKTLGLAAEKQELLDQAEEERRVHRRERRHLQQQMVEIKGKIEVRRKEIFTICAKARNEYSKTQIKRDFRAGLREMKRQAGLPDGQDLDDDIDEDDDDDDDDHMSQTISNLNVHCVSALEFLKLTGKLPRKDGEAQVFSTTMDTGIPGLKTFVDDLTKARRVEGTKRLVSCIGQMVADLYGYLADRGTKSDRLRGSCKSIFVELLAGVRDERIQRVIEDITQRIDTLFSTNLNPKAEEGVENARRTALETVTKWGSKVNRENPPAGGLYWATYKATVKREGVYKSPSRGPVDFNEDLAGPMYASITIVWDRIFNHYLHSILDSARRQLIAVLEGFGLDMKSQLIGLGVSIDRIERVRQQQLTSANNKLTETIRQLHEFITERQREASRVVTPSVQSLMLPVYVTCTNEVGKGQFDRMRNHMLQHVDHQKQVIFDSASQQLLNQLLQLQNEVVGKLKVVCDGLLDDLTMLYEPLWEAPDNTRILRNTYLIGVKEVCVDVDVLYRNLELSANEEYATIHEGATGPVNPRPSPEVLDKHPVMLVGRAPVLSIAATAGTSRQATLSTFTVSPNMVAGPVKREASLPMPNPISADRLRMGLAGTYYMGDPPKPEPVDSNEIPAKKPKINKKGKSKKIKPENQTSHLASGPTGAKPAHGVAGPVSTANLNELLCKVASSAAASAVAPPNIPLTHPSACTVINRSQSEKIPSNTAPSTIINVLKPSIIGNSNVGNPNTTGNVQYVSLLKKVVPLKIKIPTGASAVGNSSMGNPTINRTAAEGSGNLRSDSPIVVKREPTSPQKRKKPVDYGVIALDTDSETDSTDGSDIPSFTFTKRRR